MKKTILTTLGVAALGIASYATTFMQVVTDDGNTVRYDVDHVTEVNFVEENVIPQDTTPVIPADTTTSDYAYVDLGLPSGTLWATYNIGATKPEEYGDYFAWGETEPKEVYDWSTYKYATTNEKGSLDSITKYNTNEKNGIVDSLSTLLPADDAATINWGSDWRMPTKEEQSELLDECYMVWTDSYNGSEVRGIIVYKAKSAEDKGAFVRSLRTPSEDYSTSDAHVFFPAARGRLGSDVYDEGLDGYYLSSSLSEEFEGYARSLYFNEKDAYWDCDRSRFYGFPVRAVRAQKIERKTYSVNFYTSDSILIETQDVVEYTSAKGVKAPTREDYVFAGWSSSIEIVTSDMSVYALYSKPDYVDLGLPSGTLWATYNIGASKPEGYGDYFAWGETEPYWGTYKWIKDKVFTKYNPDIDSYSTLLPEDDAATANWGDEWRMPTKDEQRELVEKCTYSWEEVNGVYGAKFTGPNGNSVFFSAAGYRDGSHVGYVGYYGYYWSSSLNEQLVGIARYLDFGEKLAGLVGNGHRHYGYPVRAVRAQKSDYVDLGLPSGTLWATYNIGATKPEEYGDYFSWGETEPKEVYEWSTYKYAKASGTGTLDLDSLIKYNFGCPGIIDSLSVLLPEDDAATANWGDEWRMPTRDEQRELVEKCTYRWTEINGVYGKEFTGPNGNSVFFPAAGYRLGSDVGNVGGYGYYWSSSLDELPEYDARYLYFNEMYTDCNYDSYRLNGFPVRAVRAQK